MNKGCFVKFSAGGISLTEKPDKSCIYYAYLATSNRVQMPILGIMPSLKRQFGYSTFAIDNSQIAVEHLPIVALVPLPNIKFPIYTLLGPKYTETGLIYYDKSMDIFGCSI